jgi:hypothetical protein
MTGQITFDAASSRVQDQLHHAAARRAASAATTRREAQGDDTAAVVVRRATAADDATIAMLAALDSAAVPAGEMLIAEVDREPQAAIEIATATVIADPFRRTAHLAELLGVRAARLRTTTVRRRSLRTRLAFRAA